MTVGELKTALADKPDDNIVQIYSEYLNESYEPLLIERVEKGDENCISDKDYTYIIVR